MWDTSGWETNMGRHSVSESPIFLINIAVYIHIGLLSQQFKAKGFTSMYKKS